VCYTLCTLRLAAMWRMQQGAPAAESELPARAERGVGLVTVRSITVSRCTVRTGELLPGFEASTCTCAYQHRVDSRSGNGVNEGGAVRLRAVYELPAKDNAIREHLALRTGLL